MRKRVIIAICVLICIGIFSSVSVYAINNNSWGWFKRDPENGTLSEVGKLVSDIKEKGMYQMTYDELSEYSYDQFMFQIHKKPSSCPKIITNCSSVLLDLDSFNNNFPIERISVINDTCVCVEYKLKKDNLLYHALVVFERTVKETSDGSAYEIWQNFGEVYFAYPSLTADFISELDTDEKISLKSKLPFMIDLEHTVYFNQTSNSSDLHSEETVFLEDGILIVEYNVDDLQNEIITVTEKTFIPYGEVNDKYPNNSLIRFAYKPDLSYKD